MQKFINIILMAVFIGGTSTAFATSEDQLPKTETSANSTNKDRSNSTIDIRNSSKFTASATVASFGTWIPFKYGIRGSYNLNSDYTIEAEYLTGSVGLNIKSLQLLEFKESLAVINLNGYRGSNSFHWIAGIGQRKYEFYLGQELLSDIASSVTGVDLSLVIVQSAFINLGLANTWILDNHIKFGVDWINLFIPFGESKIQANFLNHATNTNLDTVIKLLGGVPTVSFLKMHVGYSF